MARYAVIVRELESGKFLLRFPDFEGMTVVAETEDAIERLAKKALKMKLQELIEDGHEVKDPISPVDATKLLDHSIGEYTDFVLIKESDKRFWERDGIRIDPDDFKNITDHLKESENIKEHLENAKEMTSHLAESLDSLLDRIKKLKKNKKDK